MSNEITRKSLKRIKKLVKAAKALTHLPLPEETHASKPLVEPADLVKEFVKAWDRHDAGAIGQLFVDDADFVNVVGLWWTSRHSITKAHAYGFEKAFQNATITLEKVSQRLVGQEAAVVIARWQVNGQVDPEGQPVDPRRGIISVTLAKLGDGTWLGVSCHGTDIALAADTNILRGGRLEATSYIKGPSVAEVAAAQLVDDD